MRKINKAVVLGSGLMGSGIASLLAAVGVEVTMLDMVPTSLNEEEKAKGLTEKDQEFRNRFVNNNFEKMSNPRAMVVYEKSHLNKIKVGNFEDDFDAVKDADWIIEVIIEKIGPKQAMMDKIAKYRKKGSFVSTNTSGIPVASIVEKQDTEFKKHFLGTHFFNPVRFMKLLELIPTPDTDPEVLTFFTTYGEEVLGKGIVIAKDTPDFVANRIGGFAMINAINIGRKYNLDVPTLDYLTGPIIGRPRSGTYRLADIVGVDLMVYTSQNKIKNVPTDKEREQVKLDEVLEKMVDKGLLGNKVRKGFYKREVVDGKRLDYILNLQTLEYEPLTRVEIPFVKEALKSDNKYLQAISGDTQESKIIWELLKNIFLYSADRVPEIADDYQTIDKGMRWGYNWEKGPFEIWSELGFFATATRMIAEGEKLPQWVLKMLEDGKKLYTDDHKESKYISLEDDQYEVLLENESAKLLDLKDGVLCVVAKTKGNAFNSGINSILSAGVYKFINDHHGELKGLIYGNQAKDFCVGADLQYIHYLGSTGQKEEVERMSREFQETLLHLKYSKRMIVSTPYGNALGAGCEIPLHSNYVIIAPETRIGLVEAGVGLVTGGLGLKERLFKYILPLKEKTPEKMLPIVSMIFQKFLTVDLALNGFEGIAKGYTPAKAEIVMNQDAMISRAKEIILENYKTFKPKEIEKIPVLGKVGIAHFDKVIQDMADQKLLSEYDVFFAKKLAYLLCGGDVEVGTILSDNNFAKIESQMFAELAVEPKTLERIMHILKTGKPLRN